MRNTATLGPLQIVHLEDDPNDVELVRDALRDIGVPHHVTTVSTRNDFAKALTAGHVDVILSDHALPTFDGRSALALARELVPGVPFILVSGTLGEEAAIDSLRNGATDYVLKHRLSRLSPAVRRALEEASERATRLAAEEALENERQFLRAVLDSLDTGVVACDRSGVATVWNPPVRALYGLPAERTVHPRDWGAHYRIHVGGRKTPIEVENEPLARALRGEHLRNEELSIVHSSGTERAVLVSGQPILDARGTEIGAVIALQDITERKRLEQQFRQAHKMEAMGQLAAGVAHDFNNLLTVITGHCELLRHRPPGTVRIEHDLEAVEKAAQRAVELTRQLLAFSRQQVLEPRVLDLNAIIADVQKLLTRVISADVELIFKPAPDLDRVFADAGQIEQILMNLIVNARDAMPTGGKITIETSNASTATTAGTRGPRGEVESNGRVLTIPARDAPSEGYVRLTVTDSGCGIPADILSHIFEPFYTTKGTGKGTGLGLSTVHGIVTQSGGHIRVRSQPGQGTEFSIYLPATSRVGTDAPKTAVTSDVATADGKTILVVDDDVAVRELVRDILQLSGYEVVEAPGADAALALVARDGFQVDGVITDVVMPKRGGRELAQRLGAMKRNLPTLYMSGYAGEDVEGLTAELRPGVAFIQKPFTPAALIRRLQEVLEAPVPAPARNPERP